MPGLVISSPQRIVSPGSGRLVNLSEPVNWNHPLNVGRIGWWKVIANPGKRGSLSFKDLVRNGHNPNDGTLTGTTKPTWKGNSYPGGSGSLFCTAGTARVSYVALPTKITPADNSSVSLAIWFRHNQTNFRQMLSWSHAGGGTALDLAIHDGIVYCDPGGASIGTGYNDNKWHFACMAYNNPTQTSWLYVDGAAPVITTGLSGYSMAGAAGGIGCDLNTSNPNFGGNLDDASIWNRTLSPIEVAQLYALSKKGYPGVLNYLGTNIDFGITAVSNIVWPQLRVFPGDMAGLMAQ